jgi:hypothetical protein
MSDYCADMNPLTKENEQIFVQEIALTVGVIYGSEFVIVDGAVKNAVNMWL